MLPWSAPLPLSAPVSGPPQWIEPIANLEFVGGEARAEIVWTTDYELVLVDTLKLLPETDNVNCWLRTSGDGGTTWDAGVSDYQAQAMSVSAANLQRFNNSMATDQIWVNATALQVDANIAYGGVTVRFVVQRPFNAEYTQIQGIGGYYGQSGPGSATTLFSGARKEAGRVDGVSVNFGSSNIAGGRVRARGIVGLR